MRETGSGLNLLPTYDFLAKLGLFYDIHLTMTTFDSLIALSKRLRAPGGCPWDRKQTIESLMKCIEEEADEVLVAIKKRDHPNLKEELGDLLFSMLMVMNIAEEKKYFTHVNVIEAIEHKIISRHTWVFGEDKVATAEEALELWKKKKKKEKKEENVRHVKEKKVVETRKKTS